MKAKIGGKWGINVPNAQEPLWKGALTQEPLSERGPNFFLNLLTFLRMPRWRRWRSQIGPWNGFFSWIFLELEWECAPAG
jgi:hypothetical protein